MAIAFSTLDRQLTRDIRQLHDYLWDSTWTGNESKLQASLIPQATQFRRVINAVHNFGSEWDGSASKDEQRLAARSAIESAAWCVSRSVGIRTMLGTSPKVSEKDFGFILNLIVNRL